MKLYKEKYGNRVFTRFFSVIQLEMRIFASMIKKFFPAVVFFMMGCTKHATVHAPAERMFSQEDLQKSGQRTRQLNELERAQISDWIKEQNTRFVALPMSYWSDIKDLPGRSLLSNGETVSYEYYLYDFDYQLLKEQPVQNQNVVFGRFEELKPVEDALRRMKSGEETTLLIPSSLAFGPDGDGDQIPGDLPVIIKLKKL